MEVLIEDSYSEVLCGGECVRPCHYVFPLEGSEPVKMGVISGTEELGLM